MPSGDRCIPFKVFLPHKGIKVGVVASSLQDLEIVLRLQHGVAGHMQLSLEDGTLICNEDYFQLLAPQTSLLVLQPGLQGKGSS